MIVKLQSPEVVGERRCAGQCALIFEFEYAATDNRGTGVGIGIRQGGCVVTGTGESEVACDGTGKRSVSRIRAGQDGKRAGGVSDHAARAGNRVVSVQIAEHLIVALEVHKAVVQEQTGDVRRCGRRNHCEGVIHAAAQIKRSTQHVEDSVLLLENLLLEQVHRPESGFVHLVTREQVRIEVQRVGRVLLEEERLIATRREQPAGNTPS